MNGEFHSHEETEMKIAEASKLLGISPQTLRIGLQQKALPFGFAVKRKEWVYIINEEEVRKWSTRDVRDAGTDTKDVTAPA